MDRAAAAVAHPGRRWATRVVARGGATNAIRPHPPRAGIRQARRPAAPLSRTHASGVVPQLVPQSARSDGRGARREAGASAVKHGDG